VIDYRQQDVAAEVRRIAADGVHTIVEVAASANASLDAQILGANGTVAIYAGSAGDELRLPIRPMMQVNARWQFVLLYTVPAAAKAYAIEDVATAVAQSVASIGEDVGLPVHHFPLERAADAHAAVEDGAVGKVLIDVAE
jgi:NADPH2:quinone reductase